MLGSAVVGAMVERLVPGRLKLMRLGPGVELLAVMAARNEPAPLSLVFTTVKVAPAAAKAVASTKLAPKNFFEASIGNDFIIMIFDIFSSSKQPGPCGRP